MMVLEGGAFVRCLSHEGGDLRRGIGALVKEAPETALPLRPSEDTARSL